MEERGRERTRGKMEKTDKVVRLEQEVQENNREIIFVVVAVMTNCCD